MNLGSSAPGLGRRRWLAMAFAPQLALPSHASTGEAMTASERAQWELLWELKRTHYVDRVLQRDDLRRRLDALAADDRDNALEAHNRLAAEMLASRETLALIEEEVTRLSHDLAGLDKLLHPAAAK